MGKKTIKDIKTQRACNDECLSHRDCILFMFSSKDNDLLKAYTSQLFGKNTRLKETNKNIDGVVRGETNCTDGLKDCTLSQELKCEGYIMKNKMSGEPMYRPPKCYEACAFTDFVYSLSRSNYSSLRYWESSLSKLVHRFNGNDMEKYMKARGNLVKLVFYTSRIRVGFRVQTASYEFQNFIAEFGGLTDLFIGMSFFTLFQTIENYEKKVKKMLNYLYN